jgi:hypothetical protein
MSLSCDPNVSFTEEEYELWFKYGFYNFTPAKLRKILKKRRVKGITSKTSKKVMEIFVHNHIENTVENPQLEYFFGKLVSQMDVLSIFALLCKNKIYENYKHSSVFNKLLLDLIKNNLNFHVINDFPSSENCCICGNGEDLVFNIAVHKSIISTDDYFTFDRYCYHTTCLINCAKFAEKQISIMGRKKFNENFSKLFLFLRAKIDVKDVWNTIIIMFFES